MSRKSKSVLPRVRKVCVVCNGSGRSDEEYHSCGRERLVSFLLDSCRCDCVPKKCPGCGGTGKRERTAHLIAREVMGS
jgi:hypothetical protein